MQSKYNELFDEHYVEEVLDNGLHVILWQKPDYAKSLFMMGTPLGGMDLLQEDENKELYHFPAGIAHFLEHKMFEMPSGDVMEDFSKLGANVNAFTGYQETCYYFSTSENPMPALNLLMDFVQELSITEESVEKEKGIIIEELHMYDAMSDNRLLMETYKSLFSEFPLKYDIGGDDASVTSITKELLEDCYRLNYHPSRMVLVGVSAIDPMILMEEIKKNQASKSFSNVHHVKRIYDKEPSPVMRETFSFEMDVTTPKIAVAYKLDGVAEVRERQKREWALKLLMDIYFSALTPDYQTWLDEEIINDFVGAEVDIHEDSAYLLFYSETKKIDEFKEIINGVIRSIQASDFDESILENLKRRYYAEGVRSFNSFDAIAVQAIRSKFDGIDLFDSLNIIQEIDKEYIVKLVSELNFINRAEVQLLPKNTK